uniref:Uncharacterized protein n=1 Tax=Rhizophagus irregularis (strain DAOM 181602 / DAOM 197198 / MUCL 43194) TaxID=747089 RepID=U9SZG5_RHIID
MLLLFKDSIINVAAIASAVAIITSITKNKKDKELMIIWIDECRDDIRPDWMILAEMGSKCNCFRDVDRNN